MERFQEVLFKESNLENNMCNILNREKDKSKNCMFYVEFHSYVNAYKTVWKRMLWTDNSGHLWGQDQKWRMDQLICIVWLFLQKKKARKNREEEGEEKEGEKEEKQLKAGLSQGRKRLVLCSFVSRAKHTGK